MGLGPGLQKLNLCEAVPLNARFGYKLLIMLFASQHLMKGFASALMGPLGVKSPGLGFMTLVGLVGLLRVWGDFLF